MKTVKCVRAARISRVDYEPGKVYELEDGLADRLLNYSIQVGPSHHKGFVLAGGAKTAAKKTATKAVKKKAVKKAKKKSASSKGPAHPLTL